MVLHQEAGAEERPRSRERKRVKREPSWDRDEGDDKRNRRRSKQT